MNKVNETNSTVVAEVSGQKPAPELSAYHPFVTPAAIPGKPTPDRCVTCGNARGTLYHGSYMAHG